MKTVSREEFTAFVRNNPGMEDRAFTGNTIAGMQYVQNGEVMAQAIYSKPVQLPGIKVIPSYQIKES